MAPNMNLFDLMKEKKMEKALKKDIRVKRLQAEVMNKKGIKVALYSASLLLEENLSVQEAAKVIGDHHDGTNQRKKSESDGVRNSKRSPSHKEKSPSRKGNSPVKEKNTVDSAEVVAVVTKMVQTLVPSIVEGVLVELEKEKVVLLGDSILRRIQRTQFFKRGFAKYRVTDLAISGSTVAKAVATFSNFCYERGTRFLPSSNLVILLGTNDFLKNGQFNYRQYHDLSLDAASSSFFKKIILIELPPIPRKPFLAEAIHEANNWIASLARKKGMKFIKAPQHVSYDGVHLDGWGMRLLATSILQLLSE